MIENFDKVKQQLRELADVVNAYKSEAVQLRVVELVFSYTGQEPDTPDDADEAATKPKRKKRTAKKKQATKNADAPAPKKGTKKASGQGAVATLTKLVEDDFFAKPRTIGGIVTHCEHNLARKFKANEFSGKLGRLVREGDLKRTKNSDNQYEYQNS